MLLVIEGHRLPGRTCGSHHDIHVGVQLGKAPSGLVPGDVVSARWELDIEVTIRDGRRDFRGPSVQGRPGERFVYLTWGELPSGKFEMFRRAKLMLSDVPDPLLPKVTARVDLTDECGQPRCARLRPPALSWD